MDKLDHIYQLQRLFGGKFTDFDNLTPGEKQLKTLEFLGHMEEEMVELRRELPLRKHWSAKKNNPVDETKLLDEYVDIIHFYVTIGLIWGWNSETVYQAYLNKNAENIKRQQSGY